jgi:hypothetical protein
MADQTPKPDENDRKHRAPSASDELDGHAGQYPQRDVLLRLQPEKCGNPGIAQRTPVESPGRRLAAARKLAGDRLYEGLKERLEKFRSLKIFMDICVRCGACADKCHFFIGTGDPKNMPVLRAELLRSVYRNDFTKAGKILGRLAGARPMTLDVLKEWWYYLFPMLRVPPLLGVLPLRHRHCRDHHHGRELLNLLG